MSVRDRSRNTESKIEGIMCLLVLLLLLPLLLLTYLAKTSVPAPANAVHINDSDVTAEKLTSALGVDKTIAQRLIEERTRRKGFESIGQILSLHSQSPVTDHQPPATSHQSPSPRLLEGETARIVESRVLVRHASQVFRSVALVGIVMALMVFFLPIALRQKWRVGGDPFLLPLTFLLCGFGIVMLFSLKDSLRDAMAYRHHAQGLVMALVALVFASRLTPLARQKIRRVQYVWVLASLALVVMLFVFGRGPEGVKLNLFGFFQPVEAIKLMLVFFAAGYLAERAGLIADASSAFTPSFLNSLRKSDGKPWIAFSLPRRQDLGPVVVMFAVALVMFFVIKDMGPGLLLFATFIGVLYLTTGKSSFVVIGAALMLLGGYLGYIRHIGVFGTRVDMWLHPFANAHPNGMQLGQAYWALASGGWEGSGLGLGMPNLLPRGQDDLAFISWSEETGLLGAWLVLIIFVCLVWRGLRIALRAGSDMDRALAFGLTALLGLQTLLILAGVTGLFPLTGIALPFLSYGNSALVADAILIGLLRAISVPASGKEAPPEPGHDVTRAAQTFGLALTIALLGVVGFWRLGQMQLWRSNEIALSTISTPDKDRVVRPHQNPRLLALANAIPRGSIYDRANRILATSRPEEIKQIAPERSGRLVDSQTRLYPYGAALAHLVGYVDANVGGAFGMMERGYNNDLRGYVKFADLLPDYRNRNLPGYQPRKGHDLHLTIDANLQRDAQQILAKAAGKQIDKTTHKPKDRAAFVLMSPETGDVLVAATFPTFDPNALTPELYHSLIIGPDAEQEHPLVNRAMNGWYPPGSTMKVATVAFALDTQPNALEYRVACNRVSDAIRWQAGGKTYAVHGIHDDKGDPSFGTIAMPKGFVQSSNIYFATLASTLNSQAFHDTLTNRMGFRHIPKQAAFDADLPYIGFGQGRMQASPLEMARLASAVANNGEMMQARTVSSLIDPGRDERDKTRKKVFEPKLLARCMKRDTAETLRDLMHSVTISGTAAGVFSNLSVPVGGKTGTAQNEQFDKEPHSWFIGFAPLATKTFPVVPKYAFACVVENGGYGKRVAGRICADVLKKLF